jgi:predicted nucleotidyltransferase component of viral defense system
VSKRLQEDFTLTLARYAVERLLYRLSRSPFSHRFVLKGAMLMNLWAKQPFRRTRDLDLLGYGEPSAAHLREVFANLCAVQVKPDGLIFDPTTIRVEATRDDQEYQGQRVRITGRLGNTRIVVQADIGFGDAVTPPPEEIEYPTILKMPAPRLRAYPREAVIAEKFHAMVVLGVRNSRMKDFFDLALIARTFTVEGGDVWPRQSTQRLRGVTHRFQQNSHSLFRIPSFRIPQSAGSGRLLPAGVGSGMARSDLSM